jgi:biopolymer transport protein ExbB
MQLTENLVIFLSRGGPTLWLIAALSIISLTIILWKIWRLVAMGIWSQSHAGAALKHWEVRETEAALAVLVGRKSIRSRVIYNAMICRIDPAMNQATAREETQRQARFDLVEARRGLRGLELISTIAPLLGLLGTVLGMIEAFQALQETGNRADPAALAGGIWEALLTTAAGMAVAIPAGVALAWFETLCERLQADLEDLATRVFTRGPDIRDIA